MRVRGSSRSMRSGLALTILLHVALVAQPLRTPAVAQTQTPEVPPDSIPADTLPRDSVRVVSPHHPLMLPALVAFGAVMLFAPSSVLLVNTAPDTTRPGFMDNHISMYVTTGRSRFDEPEQKGSTSSQSIEFLQNGIYGELRVEHFDLPDDMQLQAARLGYLIHPHNAIAGGVTLGYRRAPQGGFREGVEIGFPLLFGTQASWARFDATYVVASFASDWNWRFQGGFLISRPPLTAGFSMEFKGPPRWPSDGGAPANGSIISLLLGIRL